MKRLARLLSLGLCGVLLYLLLRQKGLGDLVTQLRQANLSLVLLALALNALPNSLLRARRFQLLLRPLPQEPLPGAAGPPRPAPLSTIYGVQFGGHVASHLLPARAGEALRTVHLHRAFGYPVGALVAAQLVEKVFDILSMALVALLALALLPFSTFATSPLTLALRLSLYGMAGLGALVLLGLYLATRHGAAASLPTADLASAAPQEPPTGAEGASLRARTRRSLGAFLQRLRHALGLLHAPRLWLGALFWGLCADAADVLMVGACLRALGLPSQGPLEWTIILVAMSALTSVPLTPGQVGIVEAGAVLVLGALGVPRSAGLAFGLLYHAVHSLSVLIPGALWLLWEGRAVVGAAPSARAGVG